MHIHCYIIQWNCLSKVHFAELMYEIFAIVRWAGKVGPCLTADIYSSGPPIPRRLTPPSLIFPTYIDLFDLNHHIISRAKGYNQYKELYSETYK